MILYIAIASLMPLVGWATGGWAWPVSWIPLGFFVLGLVFSGGMGRNRPGPRASALSQTDNGL